MKELPSCFKAYDIRGRVPEDLSPALARAVGQAYVGEIRPSGPVVVGRDMRLESPDITAALIKGLTEAGADVIDIGECGTEEVYFQTFHKAAGGGVMITASHNPKGFNGMKLVREGARPISGDSGLRAIGIRAQGLLDSGLSDVPGTKNGQISQEPDKQDYIDHLLGYVDRDKLSRLRIVANAGNGMAGPVLRELEPNLPFEMIILNEQPDGNFPNGVPNPLLIENRTATAQSVVAHSADFGIAWDGDSDRCFFFDAAGRFIEGYYVVGLLADMMLTKHPGERIVHDPRLTWNTIDLVTGAGGTPVQTKTGHAFIKERMRLENAVYGGEMSAHHYFRDFAFCDSGMIPWLLIAEYMGRVGKTLAQLVDERIAAFPCSGEINYRVDDAAQVLSRIEKHFASESPAIDRTDGLSLEFDDWRMNVRASNTEPLLRLNVETRGDAELLKERVADVEALINRF